MEGDEGGGAGCSSICSGSDMGAATVVEQLPGTTYYYQISEVFDFNGQIYIGPPSNELRLTTPGPRSPSMINKINILPVFTGHRQTASDLVVDFSSGLNPADAQNLSAYHLVTLGKLNKKTHQQATKPVKLTSAVYNPTANTVTLSIKGKLPNQPLKLSVNTSSVLDTSGQPIAGTSGQAGGSFQTTFGKKGITL
jgi:hypothetical protein